MATQGNKSNKSDDAYSLADVLGESMVGRFAVIAFLMGEERFRELCERAIKVARKGRRK